MQIYENNDTKSLFLVNLILSLCMKQHRTLDQEKSMHEKHNLTILMQNWSSTHFMYLCPDASAMI